MQMFEDAQRLTPGGVGGIRRPYNFVVGEYPVFITHGRGGHRHTEEDLRRALDVVEEALAYVAEQYPWKK